MSNKSNTATSRMQFASGALSKINAMKDQSEISRTKNEMTPKTFSALCITTLLLLGCNTADQLPLGASLTIAPTDRTLTVEANVDQEGTCFIDPNLYIDRPVVLSLTSSDGSPIAHQDIRVYVDFGANTFSGFPVMELYDDRRGNNNGVVDDFELVSGVDDDIAVVQTDRFGGDRELLLRTNISCPYRGEVFAFVDGVSASSSVEIVARDGDDPVAFESAF